MILGKSVLYPRNLKQFVCSISVVSRDEEGKRRQHPVTMKVIRNETVGQAVAHGKPILVV